MREIGSGSDYRSPSFEVDAVVAWVDGADPTHLVKRSKVLGQGIDFDALTIPAGVDPTRFENNNEIEYCLRSIRRFAPWVRTIHLVTDQQCPGFLTEAERARLGVSLVDHQVIFRGYEEALPTFNSLSIESVLHRIPGIASRYLYLNDDFILMSPTTPSDFFWKDAVVLRGEWCRLKDYGQVRLLASRLLNRLLKRFFGINRAMSALQQMRGAELGGAKGSFFKVGHSPYPIKRETLEAFFLSNERVLRKNIAYKFRNLNQFAVTALANQIEISQGHARLRSPGDCLMICFNRDSQSQIDRKIERLASGKVRFACIQSLEEAGREQRDRLLAVVEEALQDGMTETGAARGALG